MVRKAEMLDKDDDGKVLPDLGGEMKPDLCNKYAKQVEKEQAKIQAIMDKASEDCQPMRDRIKELFNDAAEDGIPKKPFKAIIRKRKLLNQAEAAHESLNDDDQDVFTKIQHALDVAANLQ